MEYLLQLQVGDWSCDGHEQSEEFLIKSNISMAQLKKAYNKGSKVLDFDLIANYCVSYEENKLSAKFGERLQEIIDVDETFEKDKDGNLYVTPNTWLSCILAVCKVGNKTFQYKLVTVDRDNCWTIGGYGLFV